MHKRVTAAVVAGGLLIGSAGGAILIPNLVAAADPTASPVATTSPSNSSSSGSSTTQASPDTTTGSNGDCANGPHGGPGGLDADDLTAAAKALGMTEADLTTALNGGQTAAEVAADKGVDVHNVIDAIVASDKAEFQAAVDAGTMTQAQADQMTANLTAHVTDEVNGVRSGGPGFPGGHHGQPPAGSSTDSSGSSTTTPTTTTDSTTS